MDDWVDGSPCGTWGAGASHAGPCGGAGSREAPGWPAGIPGVVGHPHVCVGGTPRLFSWWPGGVSALRLPGQRPRLCLHGPRCVFVLRLSVAAPFPVWDLTGLAACGCRPPGHHGRWHPWVECSRFPRGELGVADVWGAWGPWYRCRRVFSRA